MNEEMRVRQENDYDEQNTSVVICDTDWMHITSKVCKLYSRQ
jgi:hypothetical protein